MLELQDGDGKGPPCHYHVFIIPRIFPHIGAPYRALVDAVAVLVRRLGFFQTKQYMYTYLYTTIQYIVSCI